MPPRSSLPLLAVLLVVGCAADAAEEPSFTPVVDVPHLMVTVIEPAAEVYWDAVGWIVDEEGTHEIVPRTPEEWEAVRNAAVVLAESGNLLLMGSRKLDDGAWVAMARAMTEVGRRAAEAAETMDPDSVFEVGGEVYAACTACHARYALETLRPSERDE